MTLATTPLSDGFGLEVHHIDLAQPQPDAVLAEIDRLVGEQGVLLFRRQLLSEESLITFAGAFGELEHVIYSKGMSPYHHEVAYMSNLVYSNGDPVGLLGDQEVKWHSDQTYRCRPATGAVLYGVEVPPTSGCTYWANQFLAYDALPADLKRALEGKVGRFSYGKRLEGFYPPQQKQDFDLKRRTPETALHPLVLVHPVTGRRALYADPVTVAEIEGLAPQEGEGILALLREHVARPEWVYRHRWRHGDVVFWDNGCTLHHRDPITSDHARLMKRMTIFLRPHRHCLPH